MVETPVDQKNPEVPTENTPLSTEERLDVSAKRLIAELQAASPSSRFANLSALLKRYETQLAQFHKHFQQTSADSLTISYASEWVLDNYYVLRQSIQQIREDLSAGFLKRLPKIDQPHLEGYPRVYFIARAYLEAQHYQVDGQRLEDFLGRIEEEVALTMGELWALPIFLRFVVIEAMVDALHQTTKIDSGPRPAILPARPEIHTDEVVSNGVVSLRTVSNLDWKDFFEHVNLVDKVLRQDPAAIYERMDFRTRDQYRNAIEEIGNFSYMPETEIARAALLLARQSSDQTIPLESYRVRLQTDRRERHVGYYLIDEGRAALEAALGIVPTPARKITNWLKRRPATPYLGGIFIITAVILAVMTAILLSLDAAFWQIALGWVLTIIPALTIASDLINRLVTMVMKPSMLPKLELEREIPREMRTLVIVPSILSSEKEVRSLSQQLEQHYLRNSSPGLHFALLSDFADEDSETVSADEPLIELAVQCIEDLNQRHTHPDGDRPFLLLHRRRVWNASENKWIGWERKRGKLHELNGLILGNTNHTFSHMYGDVEWLRSVRYVITLDADTILPINAANRLIGTLAHPLNQALFAPNSNRILAGYTILQPRVEISPRSANRSWFTRIFSGDIGLDLYARAVSDVYQDISGEGSYVGKGIYDVQAFELSTAGHIPENRLLSHDLFEGLLGRAGLVTDITMIEDYPPNYFAYARRQHRWIRGDWQLLPWLLNPGSARPLLSTLDRWKMFDNLRRSLMAPGLLALFLAGWLLLPPPTVLWVGLGLLTLGAPLLIDVVQSLIFLVRGKSVLAVLQPLWFNLLRRLLALVFLPFEAIYSLAAIVKTLFRLYVSRRDLLQWTTAAHTALQLKGRTPGGMALQEMGEMVLIVAVITGLVFLFAPDRFSTALILLLPWLLSPAIAAQLNRRVVRRVENLTSDQIQRLRSYAHRTWSFYEQFVGPEDHWLPPDHYQEDPLGIVAHRTSPTNTGMLLTATLAAYELGYIDHLTLVSRLSATMDTLSDLTRYRGHFINWIDTRSLQPLTPRYVSTVDSGNLAACLIITAQSVQAMNQSRIFRWQRWQGFLDILSFLEDTLTEVQKNDGDAQLRELLRILVNTHTRILEVRGHSEQWYDLFLHISGPLWQDVTKRLAAYVASNKDQLSADSLQRILHSSRQVDQHLRGIERTIRELVPWIPLMESLPAVLTGESFAAEMDELREKLPYSPVLNEIRANVESGLRVIETIRAKLDGVSGGIDGAADALTWLADLSERMQDAAGRASILLAGFNRIAIASRRLVEEMDFRFLYNESRRVFHIGYNLDSARLDDNFYDLLASEARITSIVAIAKGDVPTEHWLHLNRPITSLEGVRVLLSWSATLFEYVMPTLFLQSYPDTLLDESTEGAVNWQIEFGRQKGVPWGVSESGFYRFDSNQNYQYQAFGVPGLGFKRGLSDDLVVAPYASLMSVKYAPKKVLQNAERLQEMGMYGLFGFYEAIDFTEKRLPAGMESGKVRSYMAHHQGMILMALLNYLKNDVMIERMHADPQIRSVDLLLQEQIPLAAPLQNPDSEDVRGTQRLAPSPAEIEPWTVPTLTSIPQVHLLSNGEFHSTITNSGSGYLSWQDMDLTRWHSDGVSDRNGIWIYGQFFDTDKQGQELWSIGKQPIPASDEAFHVTYHAHMAVLRRSVDSITATMEVTVAADDALELRRVHLHNPTDHTRRMRLTSYGEVILTGLANDARHPAFNKLFIQSEYLADYNLLIFRRRPRSSGETPIFLGHMLVTADQLPRTGLYETDRAQFLGRGGSTIRPARLTEPRARGGSTGSTLDPIFSISQNITLAPHDNRSLAWLTFAARSREELLAIAARYQDWQVVERTFQQSHRIAESRLRRAEISSEMVANYQQLMSALRYPLSNLRADPEIIASNRLGQSGLWPFGISGDFPILLVQVSDPRRLDLVHEALLAHRYWREHGVKVDLVILNEQGTDYGAEMNRLLYRLMARSQSDIWINQRGGVFIIYADQMKEHERILLKTAALVVLNGDKGGIRDQMPGYTVPVRHLPAFTPSRSTVREAQQPLSLPEAGELLFFNGHGGFTPDGREYVIELPPGQHTPLPWSNIVGYPGFGFLVTEAGSSTTWAVNSGENRLTPWSNDPVTDPTGEALYLRDEETGEIWSPTPQPAGEGGHYRVRHGAGYTQFEHASHGLRHRLRLFGDPQEPVKIIQLKLENTWDRPRRITATQYVEWVLGTLRPNTQPFLIPEFLNEQWALLATNPYSAEFPQRVAVVSSGRRIHGWTADRLEFIGRGGSLHDPIALRRIGLEARAVAGDHTCAVLQVHIDLEPGASDEIYFVIGQGADRAHAVELIERFRSQEQVTASWDTTQAFWSNLLDAVQVSTPEAAMDLLLNRWLLYQALSCRIWGRTAFYQSSGAFGFRDQLQDVMALLPIAPDIARAQILNAARHQFEEGDVLHWWHPPYGRGVRTRITDDLLWLPYVVFEYIQATGDESILLAEEPFRHGPLLGEHEEERYGEFGLTEESYSIFEHCRRAVEKGTTSGPHDLPLIGTGDWNDGMNRVGVEGRGESVWLAWFLYETLQRYAELCQIKDLHEEVERIRQRAEALKIAIETHAWDGNWYLRAFYDSGDPLGSHQNQECQIDSIAQSWSILSEAGDPARARQAMDAVRERLVRPEDRLLLLFTPPFDQTPHDPGYIKGYVPGIRENGGQYTHATTWAVWAFAKLGQGTLAGDLYRLLNPIEQAKDAEDAQVYKVEPYVVAADVYSTPPHVRRGGWTWYTGSSGWMYRLGVEALLGFRREGSTLVIDPAIPAAWDQFNLRYRFGEAVYHIHVRNPQHVERGVVSVEVNGKAQEDLRIPLNVYQGDVQVEVTMG